MSARAIPLSDAPAFAAAGSRTTLLRVGLAAALLATLAAAFLLARAPQAADSLLPAIYFLFSRARCDEAVRHCLDAGFRVTDPSER